MSDREIKVDNGWIDTNYQYQLQKLGYQVGRANDEWILFHDSKLTFETTDHVLFHNYLKLLLED